MSPFHFLCFFALLFIFTCSTQAYFLDNDDFYTPPPGFESTAPGTVLKSRTIQPGFLGFFPTILAFKTYQLLFRTTAIDGSPIASVTTVFVPWSASKDRLVAYDAFEDSTAAMCAPSRNFQLDGTASNLLVQLNTLILQAYLLKNWIVSVADDERPHSAFGAGRLAGMIILDSIRAVKSFSPIGLEQNAMVVGSGYSGGAIGIGCAAGLKESYANELNVVGWAMGGTPANLTGTFTNIDGQLFAGFIPAAIAGIATPSAYPQLQEVINRIATQEGKDSLDYVRSHCATDDILHFNYKHFQTESFSTVGDQLLYQPEVVKILNDNLMGRNPEETPRAPILLYHSTQDGVIPMSNATALRDNWCSKGAQIQFNTYLESGHGGLSIRALVDVLDFVERAFEGVTDRSCTQKTIQPAPFSLPFLLEPLFIGLFNLLQRFGHGDSGIMQSNGAALGTTVSMTAKDT